MTGDHESRGSALLINNETAVKAGAKNRQQPVDLIAAIVSVIQPHSYTVTGFSSAGEAVTLRKTSADANPRCEPRPWRERRTRDAEDEQR